MQLNDDPTIARIREVRHQISEEFGHDLQKIIKHYIELQKEPDDLKHQSEQAAEDQRLEPVSV